MKREHPHTPGPWYCDCGEVIDGHGSIIATRHSRRGRNVQHGWGSIQPVEADSNCQLLAAAPAMSAALELALQFVPADATVHGSVYVVDVIRDALSKAGLR